MNVDASRLLPGDLLRIGSIGLRTRKLRASLSALGIAIGIASMVGVLGISESSKADLIAALDRLGTNLLTVEPGQEFFTGDSARLPRRSALMVGRIGPVQKVSAITTADGSTVRRTSYIDEVETNGLRVVGADIDLLSALGGTVDEGGWLDAATARYPAAVLGAVAAERLGIDGLSGRVRVYIDGRWFPVVGILDPMPLAESLDRSVMVGRSVAVQYLGAPRSPSKLYVRTDPDDLDQVRNVLGPTANPENPEEVRVSRPSDALEARAAAKSAFTALFVGLGGVALIVGGLGIANVMVISVLERRSEIGLRRAVGATKRHVWTQFLTESLVLALVGGIAGVAIGAAVTMAYASSRGWQSVVPAYALGAGFAAAVLIGAIAGLYPAVRAARLSPTDALRTV